MLKKPNNKTILVADDVRTNRKFLEHMLSANGFHTTGVHSGRACLEEIAKQLPDLVLLDIMMPDMDGIEVCRRLRRDKRAGSVPVIFVTAATDDQTLSRAFDAGGNDYIRKPVNHVELIKRVQATLDHERLIETKREEEKLRSVLSMSGTICHEINQPLQYLSGISQLLLMDLAKGSPAHEKVRKMMTQIERMAQITKKLMQINRVEDVGYVGDTKILNLD